MRAGESAAKAGRLAEAKRQYARAAMLAPTMPEGHAALGSVLLRLREYKAALQQLSRAHALAPGNAEVALLLAEADVDNGLYGDGAPLFRQLAASSGGPRFAPEDFILFALALSATGDEAGAEQTLRAGVAQEASSAELHDALGTMIARRGGMEEALGEFRQAVALGPESAKAQYHEGVTLLALGRPLEAVSLLQRCVSVQPREFDYQLQLGRALSAVHEDAKALYTLHAAVTLVTPRVPAEALYALALALQASGDAAASLPVFEQAAKLGINSSEALTNHALALVQTGDAKDALPLYERAVAQGPDQPTLREDYGVAYLQQSDLDHALAQFRAGLALDSKNAHLHYDLGLALKLKDDLSAAVPEFERAAELDPTLPDPAYTLGVIYMQQGRFEEAATQLTRATTLQPGDGDAWAVLGSVLKEAGRQADAREALRRAIALEPDQPGLHIELAALESQAGEKDAAAQERKVAADLSRAAAVRQRASFALKSGRSLLGEGKVSEAISQLTIAVEADSGLVEGHRLLADAYTRQGSTAKAAIERKTASALAAQAAGAPAGRP
ncbi:MAG: tetratricopeptide repeat protein [Acidobacteriota bacterium]|nr:tetratricopeptide repeat protein [Acidobacteriota bacterium]